MEQDPSRDRVLKVREIAQSKFISNSTKFRPWALLRELSAHRKGAPIEALEAEIMLLLGKRAKAARMRRCMGELLNRRIAEGNREAFSEFEGFLETYVPREEIVGHDFHTVPFSKRSHGDVWLHVEELLGELSEMGEGVFLNSGTLLGVTRDQRLLDHDDDIDLAFMLSACTEVDAAAEWIALRYRLMQAGLVRLEDQPAGVLKLMKLVSPLGFEVDLFPAWRRDGKVFVYPHSYGNLSEEDVFPLRRCEVTKLPIPANPEKMLISNYGAAWQQPNPYFVFKWRRANRKFSGFLSALQPHRPKRVLTYGTFDLMHIGHVRLLKRLSQLAPEVIVGCSTTEFNTIKGKSPICSYEQRKVMLEACQYVTRVIPEDTWAQKREDILKHKIDLFVMGDDWEGKFDDLSDLCTVLYLPRTEDISTTQIKQEVQDRFVA